MKCVSLFGGSTNLNTNCSSGTFIQTDMFIETFRLLDFNRVVHSLSLPSRSRVATSAVLCVRSSGLARSSSHFSPLDSECVGKCLDCAAVQHQRGGVTSAQCTKDLACSNLERELLATEFCTAGSAMVQLWGPRSPRSLTRELVFSLDPPGT